MSGKGVGPLAGVRVIDLTSVVMGPYTTQIFADLGADVIKIESPDGDTTRALPPIIASKRGGMFLNMNRGKRSLVLDLKQPSARDALLRLVMDADIFIHSMRSAAIARLGLDYAPVKAANAQIIYANLYGYGRDGPYADYPAYDDIMQAACGLADLQAQITGGSPGYVASAIADKITGLTGCYAVIAALYAREKTGVGQELEIPMFETMTSFVMAEHLCGAITEPAQGKPMYPRVVAPDRKPYRTQDGYIGAMIYNDKQWRNFFALLGNPDWANDPMFSSLTMRANNISAVLAKVAEIMVSRTTSDWVEAFRGAEIPAMPIYSTQDLLDDPHLEATGFWHRVSSEFGPVRMPGIPTKFSATPGAIGDPGPDLGVDSISILEEAGFSADEIAALKNSGALPLL
jgi:crotonobetainyl-CoA:carnitine CoA-transferase CaiB-like acyl-CoA transferase